MTRLPVIYFPHGGGPWPFVELRGFLDPTEVEPLREYFLELPERVGETPRALLVISAHWEERVPTVLTAQRPPIFYDYYGFPPESYTIEWPAPGHPELAARVQRLLADSGFETAADDRRGFDHGTFIPLKVSYPKADIPTIQLSLKAGLDPAEHLAIGEALAPLRDEGVLIFGSGMSFHDLRAFGRPSARQTAEVFDTWLRQAATAPADTRSKLLMAWSSAPAARQAHPREEHLLPLMVVAGAAGADVGRVGYSGEFGRARISAFHYG
jgi:aromatic ring-opening dioxygenase catalytic subunit (LigB family)